MDRLWRYNSSVSSRIGCPSDIVSEEETLLKKMISRISRNGISQRLILSPSTRLAGLRILSILNTKFELLNNHFLFQGLMKNVVCFLKEILMISLLKNSVICILVLFKLLLNCLLEKVSMLLFSCV